MTQYPEAYLARELGLCYAGLALVTDRDVGVEGDPDHAPVTMEAALAVLAANVDHTRTLLEAAIPEVPVAAGVRVRGGRGTESPTAPLAHPGRAREPPGHAKCASPGRRPAPACMRSGYANLDFGIFYSL